MLRVDRLVARGRWVVARDVGGPVGVAPVSVYVEWDQIEDAAPVYRLGPGPSRDGSGGRGGAGVGSKRLGPPGRASTGPTWSRS